MKKVKNKKIRTSSNTYKFSFLERRLTIEFLVRTKFQLGPKYNDIMTAYSVGIRRHFSVLNLYALTAQLKNMLHLIYLHSYMREKIVVVTTNQQPNAGIGYNFYFFANGWIPGFLTNFRKLMRRALAEYRYRRKSKLTTRLSGALYLKPHLPTMAIALSGLNFCFRNEALNLKILHLSALNKKLPQYNTSSSLILNKSYLPTNIMLRLIRETINASTLTDRLFCERHNKRLANKVAKRLKKFWKFPSSNG